MLDWNEYRKELGTRIGEIGKLSPDTLKGYLALSGAGENHYLVFQALTTGRRGYRRQGKGFSHGSKLQKKGTTKAGHLSMAGLETWGMGESHGRAGESWDIWASLHLFYFFSVSAWS